MKITIIHGQSHNGSTCHIARQLAEKLHGEVTEFFLPRDFGQFCVGCMTCIKNTETKCPHYAALAPLTAAMDEADVLILASPVYVYHVTGAMKAFLDHYGYRWMIHRPEAAMFTKQAVCISTAAGAGSKSTNRDMADSFFFWGVGKIYRLGMSVFAAGWADVSEKNKAKIEKRTDALAKQILARQRRGHIRPGLKARAFFAVMQRVQRKGFNPADAHYWQEKGWTAGKKPW